MMRILQNITETLADAALLEMGVPVALIGALRPDAETLEENLVEVAFAEADDYDEIHEAILREHWDGRDMPHPDDCPSGGNDICYA